MVEKCGVEGSGVEMSSKLIVRGHFNPVHFNPRPFNPGFFNHELSNPGFFNPRLGVESSGVEAWG